MADGAVRRTSVTRLKMEFRAMAKLLGLLVLFTVLSISFGCSSADKGGESLQAGGPFAGLPPIPLDVAGHGVSDVHNASINGVDTFLRSAGAISQGQNLLLFTGVTNPPSLEWGLYRYVPDSAQDEVVGSATLNFTVNAGPDGWIGIANYGTGMWEFKGPFADSGGGGSKTFSDLDGPGKDYTSPAGNLYFLVVAYNGTTVTINGVSIVSDVTPAATFTISGRALDSSTSQGISGAQIHLNPGNLTVSTNVTGDFSFAGLGPGVYTLTADTVAGYNPFSPLNIPVSITNTDSSGNDFTAAPLAAAVTYETGDGILKQKLDTYCVTCHSTAGGQQPHLASWADLVFYDTQWPQGSFQKLVDKVTVGTRPDMPEWFSSEETAINNAGDRHWFSDWAADGFQR